MKRGFVVLVMLATAGVAVAQEFVQYIPAAASAAGANNSFFVTDVRLFNPNLDETITRE